MAEFPEGRIKSFTVQELHGTRCRLQRISDLKFFSGWVRQVTVDRIKVELKGKPIVATQDRFNVEASIEHATVSFPCDAIDVHGNMLTLDISGEPTLSTPGQEARYQANGITVSVHRGDGTPVQAEAVDISANGLGILTYDEVPRFAKTRLAVRGPFAAVECVGMVRYCRQDTVERDAYRIGFEIQFEDRLSKAMWLRLVLGASKAPAQAA